MKKENLGIFITVLSGTIFTLCIVGYLSKLEGTTKKNQNPTETTAEAVDSLVQEYFVRKAEAKGFKKGVIQHSLNTKWSEFADRSYYSYIKTLKSGMKLYRAEATNMMMEVYVLKGYIKIQSSNIILHDKTSETLKSMDAWLMSCNPLTVIGDISSTKEYNFHD